MKTAESKRLVFVSYATPDKEEADRIVGQLEHAGITCWMAARDVPLGSNYAESIVDAIERAELMILLLSTDANASPHVANEIERAVNYRKPIVPVRLADVRPSRSIELHISTRQWVEMWGTTESRQAGMTRLVATLREALRDQIAAEASALNSAHTGSPQAERPRPQESGALPVAREDEATVMDPGESDRTELEIIAHDGTSTFLWEPSVGYPGGWGPSKTTEGIAVRRGVEESTLLWSRLRTLKFRSRQEKNDKGTTVWRHVVEATLAGGRVTEVELQDDWNMAYMGGGGTGLLCGQSDLGETKIPFTKIALLKILKYARLAKK